MIRLTGLAILSLAVSLAMPARAAGDYPTSALADYVFACMMANGRTREALERCSCSIDVVASILPYSDYERAETFKRMGQMLGERGVLFRDSAPAKEAGAALRRAQAEADMRCF
jgi:hypothetical protein